VPAPERLVLGYGDLADPLVDEAVSLLAAAVRDLAARSVGASR
jgi:GntR family transcriptional regulator/MocR family aminotransferase